MPTLNWAGKDKVVNHHHEVPFRVLDKKDTFLSSKRLNSSGNRIIHGDNLEALKSLIPEFEGKVDCIYIDPPYNTGNEGWVYNDNVNDQKINKWLGKVVGAEGEDLSRHDKWLCMMYPRLSLLKRLLKSDGSIWISIDDCEVTYLRCILDEIFGKDKFVACNVWQKRYSRENRGSIGDAHEYVIVYSMDPCSFQKKRNLLPITEDQAAVYKNANNDPNGRWRTIPMNAPGFRPNQMYEIETPSGKIVLPPEGRCWSTIESEYLKLKAAGKIYFGKKGDAQPSIIRYLSEVDGIVPWTWWPHEEVGHTDESRKEIRGIFGSQTAFDTPKPTRLIERIIQIATDKNSVILDSFAGSGTTGHAVLKANANDGGERKFILIEAMDYAKDLTSERIKIVMDGYNDGKQEIAGLGGSFDYFTIGETLFKENEILNENVGVNAIRNYIAHSEGISDAERTPVNNPYSPYVLGLNNEIAWVFNYEPGKITTLDTEFLTTLRFGSLKPRTAIIYADRNHISQETLDRIGVKFKKIPRDITRF